MKFIRENVKQVIEREVRKSLKSGEGRITKVELSEVEWANFTQAMSPEMVKRHSHRMAFEAGGDEIVASIFNGVDCPLYHEVEVVRISANRVGGF